MHKRGRQKQRHSISNRLLMRGLPPASASPGLWVWTWPVYLRRSLDKNLEPFHEGLSHVLTWHHQSASHFVPNSLRDSYFQYFPSIWSILHTTTRFIFLKSLCYYFPSNIFIIIKCYGFSGFLADCAHALAQGVLQCSPHLHYLFCLLVYNQILCSRWLTSEHPLLSYLLKHAIKVNQQELPIRPCFAWHPRMLTTFSLINTYMNLQCSRSSLSSTFSGILPSHSGPVLNTLWALLQDKSIKNCSLMLIYTAGYIFSHLSICFHIYLYR